MWAPRTGFEPVTYRLTDSLSQKYRSVDLLWPEKPVHAITKSGSLKMLSGHNSTGPVGRYFHRDYYITTTNHIAPQKRRSEFCKHAKERK